MLSPIANNYSPRYVAIDKALSHLPQVVTRIVDEYEGPEREVIDLLMYYDVRKLSTSAASTAACRAGFETDNQRRERVQRRINWEQSLSPDDHDVFGKLQQVWRSVAYSPYAMVALVTRFRPGEEDYPVSDKGHIEWLDDLKSLMDDPLVLTKAVFSDYIFEGSVEFFYAATLTDVRFIRCTFRDVNFTATDFTGSEFIDVSFEQCTMSRTILAGAKLIRTKFIHSYFVFDGNAVAGAEFIDVSVEYCNLSRATWAAAKLIRAKFISSYFESDGNVFAGTELIEVTFQGCSFGVTAFRGGRLIRTKFIDIPEDSFCHIDFRGAVIESVQFSGRQVFWYAMKSPGLRMTRFLVDDFIMRLFNPGLPLEFTYTLLPVPSDTCNICPIM